MDLNKVMLIGRATKDAEVRQTTTGQQVGSFTLATSKSWTDKATGQKKSQSEFHNVVVWGKLADVCAFVGKGKQVYVEGRLQTRSWDDPSGVKKYKAEIIAENIILLGGRIEQKATELAGQQPAFPDPVEEDVDVDNIPF